MKGALILFFGLILLWLAFSGRAALVWTDLINGPKKA